MTVIYKNRIEAGRILSDKLHHYRNREDVLVLGLPRGGVVVAGEVARELRAELDVIVVRKLGMPGREEVAMGAIATGGVEVMNKSLMHQMRMPDSVIEKIRLSEKKELARRERAYRGSRPPYALESKIVILADDGIATGSTMQAAVMALRQFHPKWIVAAAPVAASDAVNLIHKVADEVVCPVIPLRFRSVGEWYHDFSQTTDAEVNEILSRSWNANKRHAV